MIASMMATTVRAEWNYWRNVFALFLIALILGVAGDNIESAYFPVIEDVKLGEAKFVPDGRLCWQFAGYKARRATGTTYSAAVYESDAPNPTHRELTHMDGTPYGGKRAGAAPGSFDTFMCVRVDHVTPGYSRLGVRVVIEFKLAAWRPYLLRQPEIWVDYYPDRPGEK